MLAPRHVVAIVALVATPALADDDTTATVAKGVAQVKVPRKLADGAVALSIKLPPDWKLHDTSMGTATFVPASAKYDRPSLEVDVPIDNVHDKLAEFIATQLPSKDKPVAGGGKLVKLITDKKKLDLAGKVHALVSTVEVDATEARHVHYVETTCFVWRDDQPFAVLVRGFAEMPDAKLGAEFEKACGTVTLQ